MTVSTWLSRKSSPGREALFDLLLAMAKAAERWRRQGARAIPKEERDDWIAQYFAVLASGFAVHWAQAPPTSSASL